MSVGESREPEELDLSRPDAYGRSFADVYDRWYTGVSDAEATARFVAERCGTGPVLEVGVGSGRLARPLAALGLQVVGIDGSSAMLVRVPERQDPGDGCLHLVLADMRALPLTGRFGACLIAFNTLFNLSTEAEQRSLLDSVGRLLAPDGVLIIEALDVTPLLAGPVDSIGVRETGPDGLVVTATQLDRAGQLLTGQHLEIDDAGLSVRPWRLRWLTPGQLDGLCHAVDLELSDRYGSWDLEPFHGAGETHISVYRPC